MAGMQAAIKELQETAIVMAGIESRHSKMLKDHAKWLQEHDRAMTEARERGRETDARIAALISAIGEFIRGRTGKQE